MSDVSRVLVTHEPRERPARPRSFRRGGGWGQDRTRRRERERRTRQLAKANEDKVPFLLPPLISGLMIRLTLAN